MYSLKEIFINLSISLPLIDIFALRRRFDREVLATLGNKKVGLLALNHRRVYYEIYVE
jgi:hypothetical protein